MEATYSESSAATPMYFVLFPGVDPTPWVEGLGKKMGLTTENGKFVNISMGQGQEAPAEAMLERCAQVISRGVHYHHFHDSQRLLMSPSDS